MMLAAWNVCLLGVNKHETDCGSIFKAPSSKEMKGKLSKVFGWFKP
jgi:LEA14-like dessication related protein